MKYVYIVEGNTGEYSDRVNWLVKAFFCQKEAEKLRDKLNTELIRLGLASDCDRKMVKENSLQMKKLDPEFRCDYTGTYYCILRVELDDFIEKRIVTFEGVPLETIRKG